jgi:PAS domain-containing protein
MPAHEPSDDDDQDGRDAVVTVETGRAGQRLVCEGWLASHADSGTPGPHVHLRTSDGEPPVLRTDQLPVFVAALTTVAERVDHLWETEGDGYAAEVVLRSPDPQDPRVAHERARNRLRFTQAVLDNLSDVMRLLTEATSTDEALVAAATLLGVDEAEVMVGLARFDLLTLTRPATERRLRELAG